MNKYVAIFFTHSGAIKFDKNLKAKDIESNLMPVPRQLSSSCGIAAKFTFEKDIMDLVDNEVEKIFIIENGEYRLVYGDE